MLAGRPSAPASAPANGKIKVLINRPEIDQCQMSAGSFGRRHDLPTKRDRPPCSGHDLGLLAFELLGRDDTPVAQVGKLGQLVRRAGWRTRSLGEVAGVAGDPPGDFPGRSAGAAGAPER